MILLVFGTRPEYIKIKPLIKVFKKNDYPYKVLFTGQHTSLIPAEASLQVDLTIHIKDGRNRLDSIISSLMNQSHIWTQGIDRVLVQGDTTSAFALAIAAFHRNIPVFHLEAGLRTYDINNPYPEEFNRQAISKLATLNFCPTDTASINLMKENIDAEKIFITGNTVLDNLIDKESVTNNRILITLHRRENHKIMAEWFENIENLAKEYKDLLFIFPMHPNPNVQKYKNILKSVKVTEPMEYNNFIDEVRNCRMIISDSGGIQEEASFFKKRVIVCRKKTERVEGLGIFSFLCKKPEDLEVLFEKVYSLSDVDSDIPSPFGDGHASEKIYKIIKEYGKKNV